MNTQLILIGVGALGVLTIYLIIRLQRKKINNLKTENADLKASIETYKAVLDKTSDNAAKTVEVVKRVKEVQNESEKAEYKEIKSGDVDSRLSSLNG